MENIDKDNINIVSFLLGYFRNKIFYKYFANIFKILKDYNFLKTKVDNQKDNNSNLNENITQSKE